ncbi:MAG: hypothetical protein ACOY0T_35580 [Myxococcota bacterium]
MAWTSIADVVLEMRSGLPRVGALPPREAGAALAAFARTPQLITELPELVNFGTLTLLAQPLRVHEIRPNVAELVAETDLHSLPGEPPRLLTAPWIAQVRDPASERLFGSTAALASYEFDGVRYLIGLDFPDGCAVARWRPEWRGGEIEAGVIREDSGGLLDVDGHEEWARAAARFAVVLGVLLDAEGTPLATADEGPSLAGRRHGKPRPARPWAVRRVYLEHEAKQQDAAGGRQPVELDEHISASVRVSGHLKRQPYGPGLSLRKWVYVRQYDARRWFTNRPTKVIVQ